MNVSGRQLGSRARSSATWPGALETTGPAPVGADPRDHRDLTRPRTRGRRRPAAPSSATLGVRLAIDDFGTGYSSLSYLRQFPVDILKIDRSFIDTINEAEHIPPLVRALLSLGRTLDVEIVAEGIEHRAQHELLQGQRCAFGQGFLFAQPLGVEEAELLIGRADMAGTSPAN